MNYIKKSSWDSLWLKAKESLLMGDKVSDPYSQHQTVFMAIDAVAANISQVNLKVFRISNDEEVKQHPILALFKSPNSEMSRSQLWEATAIHYMTTGGSFWIFDKSLGQEAGTSKVPASIWPMSQDLFTPVKDNLGRLQSWKYAGKTSFAPEEVVQFKKFNRKDFLKGFSPLTPIEKTIDQDYKALLYNSAFFENSAEMGGYLSTDKALTDVQYKRLLEAFEQRHKGYSKSKKPGLLEGGLKYTPAAETHRDMEFLEQRRYNREEILGIYRAPKSIFSITEDLNYATAIAQKKLFWQGTIIPMLKYFEDVLNGKLFPRFAPDLYCQFDLSEVPELQEDFKEKVATAKDLHAMGFTANEINERLDLGFEEKEWRDYWWIPFGVGRAGEDPFSGGSEDSKPSESGKLARISEILKKDSDRKKKKDSWELFVSSTNPIEKKMADKMKSYFYRLRTGILKEIEKNFSDYQSKGFSDFQGFRWDQYDDLIKRISIPFILESAKKGSIHAASVLGAGGVDFDIFNPKIISYAKSRESKITGINTRIRASVEETVREGIRSGLSVSEVSDHIREVFNTTASRSVMIARTEVIGAANGGQMLYYQEAGITRKEWVTSKDENVRESHEKMDGVVAPVAQRFPNGLMQPGGEGPAEEVINCRCTIVPVIE